MKLVRILSSPESVYNNEETGAVDFDLNSVCICGVTKDSETIYGTLLFADVKTLGKLLMNVEIGVIMLSHTLPNKLTYPEIQPCLHERTQAWLNLKSSANELWDVYDDNRNLTGRTHRRGDQMNMGDYHLVVHVWLQNSKGEYLLTKRTPNKGFPNMWECTGGSALVGDDSLSAALREVKEETGLTVLEQNGQCVMCLKRENDFCDIWLFKQDFSLDEVVFQPGETCDAMYATKETILNMKKDGTLVPFLYLDELFTNRFERCK